MGLPIPNLDDKTFDQLVEEARSLIVKYAPEWTDHNVHDPGITFIELFAWLAEMQIYQVNRITDSEYEKFLNILGFYLEGPKPAKAIVFFPNIDKIPSFVNLTSKSKKYKFIASGTQIVTSSVTEKIVFETGEDLTLVPIRIVKILTSSSSRIVDNTAANDAEEIYFAPFGEKASEGSAFHIGFDRKFPMVEIQLTFILSEEDLPIAGTHRDEEDSHPSPQLIWEYTDENGGSEPLNVVRDTTYGLTRSGRVVFGDLSVLTKSDGLWWISCRLSGRYEIVPRINRILLNSVPVIQIETVRMETVGTGQGIPDQKFQLRKSPVIWGLTSGYQFYMDDVLNWSELNQKMMSMGMGLHQSDRELDDEGKRFLLNELNRLLEEEDLYQMEFYKDIKLTEEQKKFLKDGPGCSSKEGLLKFNRSLIEAALPSIFSFSRMSSSRIVLRIKVNGEWEEWFQVENFDWSGPKDPHYTLDWKTGEINFGNGLNGRIPQESEEIRVDLYRTSQGEKGNIPKGQKFDVTLSEIGTIVGSNVENSKNGENAESIDDGKHKARKDFRLQSQAVTAVDYETLARWTPGLRIARTKALVNYHPDYPCSSVPGIVTVIVVPVARKGTNAPVPGEQFRQMVLEHLNRHRLITSVVNVIGPIYFEVSVACKIHLRKTSDPKVVTKKVEAALTQFLDPLVGGPDGIGWPFGRAVYVSELYQVIDKVEGVNYASNISVLSQQNYAEALKLPPIGLVVSGKHQIEYDF